MKIEYRYQTKNMNSEDLVKCMKKKAVIILMECTKIYLFCKEDESEIDIRVLLGIGDYSIIQKSCTLQ